MFLGTLAMVEFIGCGDSTKGAADNAEDIAASDAAAEVSADADTTARDTGDLGLDSTTAADIVDTAGTPGRPAGWTRESHSKDVPPNIAEVFSDTEVKRIDIAFGADTWAAMMADMTDIYGTPGGGGGQGSDQEPAFVAADIRYKGVVWRHVGVRFKGNSSLRSTWQSGNLKLSFKLDFDHFEDDFPEIDNQRFYGIKELSLKNNFNDQSLVREKVMADLFAAAGMVVSHTAFCAVYVDHGQGPEYFGLYTMAEEVDDSVLKTQFDDNKGNLYKPNGTAAQLSLGSFNEDELVKVNNKAAADFSDIKALLASLHASTRTSAPETWRQGLSAVFNTDVFLKYLAINGIAQNWDTYGRNDHNYFLYNAHATSKLTWIPWDNNEALQDGRNGGSLPLDFAGLSAPKWPLIAFLYADATYRATYEGYLRQAIDGPLAVAAMHARYDAYEALLAEYAAAERPGFTFKQSPTAFAEAFVTLGSHAQGRVAATQTYLGQ